jgi:hypothetical protein
VLFSIAAMAVNLGLVAGALGRRPAPLLIWLIFYLLNIIGSLGELFHAMFYLLKRFWQPG